MPSYFTDPCLDDSRLVSPILLTSKVVIFNWKDSLQVDRMLNLLGVLARAAQGVECSTDAKIFGHLHMYGNSCCWCVLVIHSDYRVFRDWNFVNKNTDEVYNELFSAERGRSSEVSVRNQARRMLLDSFESIKIWLFPAPVCLCYIVCVCIVSSV